MNLPPDIISVFYLHMQRAKNQNIVCNREGPEQRWPKVLKLLLLYMWLKLLLVKVWIEVRIKWGRRRCFTMQLASIKASPFEKESGLVLSLHIKKKAK